MLDLMIQVLDLPPMANKHDLITFFSYCGSVDDVRMQRAGDNSLLALIIFSQPYAQKTALLLNGAEILGHHVRILPIDSLVLRDVNVDDEGSRPSISSPRNGISMEEVGTSSDSESLNIAKNALGKQQEPAKGTEVTSKMELATTAVKQGIRNIEAAVVLLFLEPLRKAYSAASHRGYNKLQREANSRKEK